MVEADSGVGRSCAGSLALGVKVAGVADGGLVVDCADSVSERVPVTLSVCAAPFGKGLVVLATTAGGWVADWATNSFGPFTLATTDGMIYSSNTGRPTRKSQTALCSTEQKIKLQAWMTSTEKKTVNI